MSDREKVLRGLECCIRKMEGQRVCDECPYDEDFNCLGCSVVLRQAVALLREQEPQEPHYCEADDSWICGNCGETVGYGEFNPGGIDPVRNKYCPECGRKVKWDDAE